MSSYIMHQQQRMHRVSVVLVWMLLLSITIGVQATVSSHTPTNSDVVIGKNEHVAVPESTSTTAGVQSKTVRYRRQNVLKVVEQQHQTVVHNFSFDRKQVQRSSTTGNNRSSRYHPSIIDVIDNIDVWSRLLQSDNELCMSFMSMTPTAPTSAPNVPTVPVPVPVPVVEETASPSDVESPTNIDDDCESLNRTGALLYVLNDAGITSATDPTSPQGMAFEWLDTIDNTTDPCSNSDTILQRYGLVTFYYSTNGSDWSNSTNWLVPPTEDSATSECTWYGLTCNTDNNRIEKIELEKNNVGGTIPHEILLFQSSMETLNLYSNKITGTLPPTISQLTALKVLDVEENMLSGVAFIDISTMKQLSSYRVSINSFTGTIPTTFYPAHMESSMLTELWFAKNIITGTIPETLFARNTQLSSLIVYENQLSGSIPSSIGLLSNTLTKVQFQKNQIGSTIPNELYSNTLLRELRLDSNQLTGTISTMLGEINQLVDLRIGENEFTGTLPAEIARLSNLVILLVNATNITGVVRDSFEPFAELRYFDLSKNRLSGPLPTSLFDLNTLEILYMFENAITGSIPSNYGNAVSLRDLYINNNMIVGTVPSIMPGQLSNLTEFLLSSNSITGIMPASICSLVGDDAEMDLVALVADCGGATPLIQCDCCNGCITP